jgi:hypothetical protein
MSIAPIAERFNTATVSSRVGGGPQRQKPLNRHERTKLLFVLSVLARISKIVLAINAKNRLASDT